MTQTTTLHLIWGKEAVARYRLRVLDNNVRLGHSVYDFAHPQLAQAFLHGVSEARPIDEWLVVTDPSDIRRLGVPLRQRLIEAAKRGDVNLVQELIKTGVSLDEGDEHGLTALHWAAKNGQEKVAEALLDAGAEIDCPAHGADYETPLHMACESAVPGALHVVDLLIERKANVEAIDAKGNHPLHLVARSTDADAQRLKLKLRLLIEKGEASSLSENNHGERPADVLMNTLETTGVRSLPIAYLKAVEQQTAQNETNQSAKQKLPQPVPRPFGAPVR